MTNQITSYKRYYLRAYGIRIVLGALCTGVAQSKFTYLHTYRHTKCRVFAGELEDIRREWNLYEGLSIYPSIVVKRLKYDP